MPHVDVDVPDKHFGMALGEARTLRTATKKHLEHRIERQKLATREDGIPTRGAGSARGVFFCARKTWGRRGHVGIAPPLRRLYVPTFPKVAIGGWRWGAWWEMPKGMRETMTGAHLGGRGARRRRSCSAIAAPRARPPAGSAGVAAMVMMGATTHGSSAAF